MRYISFDGVEIVRSVYVAVRDRYVGKIIYLFCSTFILYSN